jgi:hypothetical protein
MDIIIEKNSLLKEDLTILTDLYGKDPFEDSETIQLTAALQTKFAKEKAKRKTAKYLLSKEDIKFIKRLSNNPTVLHTEKIDILLQHFRITRETLNTWLSELKITIKPSQFSKATFHTLKKKKRYLISSAQNGSPVNKNFLHNIEKYAEFIDAEIGIIATRYKNPTSIWKEEGDVWDPACHKYLTAKRQELHKNLILLADLKIQATSPNPTNGLELFGDNKSVIVGAPRIEMRSIPVLPTQTQKFLYSTGTVTAPSFTDSVAGGKAAEHHSYGFVIVEIENDDIIHIRNISAHADGTFNDLIYRVANEEVSIEGVDVMVWGDSHFAQKNEKVTNAFRKLAADMQIKISVLHDIWDSESINVHNIKDPIIQHKLQKENKDDLRAELLNMSKELRWFSRNMKQTIVVNSNHDDMLDRAMVQSDWRDNLKNAEIFVKLLSLKLSGKAEEGLIAYHINKKFDNITALGKEESYILYGIELGLHGHKGSNGAKGNINTFAKLSNKTIIGHSHSPAIKWGCYQVGVSCSLKHGYNKGLSGWAYNSVILNKYGKRQSITLNKDTLTYTTLY